MLGERGGRREGLLLITLAALTWGTIGVAVSLLYSVADTNPSSVGLLRLLVAAPALLLLSRVSVSYTHLTLQTNREV